MSQEGMAGAPTPVAGLSASDVLDAIPDLVLVTEVGTRALAAINESALTTTGFQRDELAGHPITDTLMSDASFEQARTLVQQQAEGGSTALFPAPLLTKSGEERRVLWSGRWLQTSPSSTPSMVLCGRVEAVAPAPDRPASQAAAGTGTFSVGTDRAGRVRLWSDEAERLLGYPRDEMLGRPLPLTLFDADQLRTRATELGVQPDLRVLTAGVGAFERRSSRRLDLGPLDRRSRRTSEEPARSRSERRADRGGTHWTLIRKDGVDITVAATVTAVEGAGGEQVAFLGVGTEVTAQQRTNDLLVSALEREARATQRLKELDAAKNTWIATVSHELRTPLTSIGGYTELLEEGHGGELNTEQRKQVGAIRRNTDRLLHMVEDMLTLSGIDAGTLRRRHEDFDLRDAVRGAWQGLHLDSAPHRLDVSLSLPATPVVVRGDAAHLARGISSLLSNAVKCTAEGGSVSCVLIANGATASVRVIDTGFGIPLDEQSSVFGRFFRTSTSRSREVQGSGLGLAIAADAVHSCGGEISVESEHLGGAVFTIELPLVTASAQPTPPSLEVLSPPRPAPTRKTDDPDLELSALDLLLDATRSLLWLRTPGEGREAAIRFIDAVGGTVVAAAPDSANIPVDVSFGVGDPVFPSAPPGSEQHRLLERYVPLLVADVNRAIAQSVHVDRLAQDATIDPLTLLPNRQTVSRTLGRLRYEDAVIMLDLDSFKQINDSFGHATGDHVLRAFGATLRSISRSRDVVGRYGGEEFVVVLSGGDAEAYLLRLQQRWTDVRPHPVTFSAGIAVYTSAAASVTAATVAADRAMYRAKRAGRDRWLLATASEYLQ